MITNIDPTTTQVRIPVILGEDPEEANGAAYLVHMLLSQRADAAPARFAALANRLQPVVLRLRDTREGCRVEARDGRLVVSSGTDGPASNDIIAESRHVVVITQLRLLGGWVIAGPLDRALWDLLKGVLRRRVRIGGLLRHYANAMCFLQMVNVR